MICIIYCGIIIKKLKKKKDRVPVWSPLSEWNRSSVRSVGRFGRGKKNTKIIYKYRLKIGRAGFVSIRDRRLVNSSDCEIAVIFGPNRSELVKVRFNTFLNLIESTKLVWPEANAVGRVRIYTFGSAMHPSPRVLFALYSII